jgi:hypothetical protein
MAADAVPDFPGQIQPGTLPAPSFQEVDHPEALLGMTKTTGNRSIQCIFSRMTEGGMPEIMPQGYGLREVFVQTQGLGHGARDLRYFQRVGQAGAIVIAERYEEYLRLVFEPPERLGVDDAIAIALESGTDIALGFSPGATAGVGRPGGERRQGLVFSFLGLSPNVQCSPRSPGDN